MALGTVTCEQTLPRKNSVRSTLFSHSCLPPRSLDFLHVGTDNSCALRSFIWSFPSLNSVFLLLLLTLCHHPPSLLSDDFSLYLNTFSQRHHQLQRCAQQCSAEGLVWSQLVSSLGQFHRPQLRSSHYQISPPTPMQYYSHVHS